jgi:hypothetical protein
VFDKETLCHLIYLFILALELLSAAIKNDPEITGVKINVLFFSFIEEIKFNTWGLFNLPRCPARGPGPLR